jgi:2-oxoglutarate dehydrogenase E2 component (dihydrolipoamide succinyltransferase)
MSIEVKVPVLPESVSDATIATWHKKAGDSVRRDENLVDLETDKVVLEVPSPVDGVLTSVLKNTGDTVGSQEVIALIEAAAASDAPAVAPAKAAPSAPAPAAKPAPAAAATADLSPAARRVALETGIDPAGVAGTGRHGQVTKGDLLAAAATAPAAAAAPQATAAPAAAAPAAPALPAGTRSEQRVPMTRMRARIAERMMQSKNSIAMLTSFNEVNMKAAMDLRKNLGEQFEKAHGVRLGIMSFFVKAAAEALKRHPVVNASVDGNDIVYHAFADISIAVATERGLVTPVLRNAEAMGFADVERAIADYANRARQGGLTIEDLQGGTFTITNGGVFGSLFSTPIVNPPQSAILGMHAVKERAIVDNGQVIAAPMMYIALSYDHRIIDGKEAVTFLVDIKNQLENPGKMLLGL